MAAPSRDELPPWRANLLSVAPERRTPFQRDLLRGLELSDFVKKKLKARMAPSLDDDRVTKVLAAGVECYLLGPLELSALQLEDPGVREKLIELAYGVYEQSYKAIGARHGLEFGQFLPAALASLQLALLLISFERWTWCRLYPICKIFADLMDQSPENWELLDEDLTAMGSRLTAATLRDALLFCHHLVWINDHHEFNDAKFVVEGVILPAAAADARGGAGTLPPWKVVIICRCLARLIKPVEGRDVSPVQWGVRLGGSREALVLLALLAKAHTACVGVLRRATAAAVDEGDAAREALYAGWMAGKMMSAFAPVQGPAIRAVADQAVAALEEARPWLPRTLRQELDVQHLVDVFSGGGGLTFRSTAYYNLTGEHRPTCSCGRQDAFQPGSRAGPGPPQLRTCAHCGAQSTEMMACGGCYSRHYCSAKHQKLHWKSHKKECKALKAAAAAAGDGGSGSEPSGCGAHHYLPHAQHW